MSLVYVAGKSMAYVHPCNTKMGGRAVKLSRKDVKELGKGEQDGGGVEKQQRGPKHRPHGSRPASGEHAGPRLRSDATGCWGDRPSPRRSLPTGEPRRDPSAPTPFSVGSPPKFSSTYQSDSHSQCGEGSATPSSGRCWSPLTSLHGQRSLGRSVSQKPPTGFQRWGPEAEASLKPGGQGLSEASGDLLSSPGREGSRGPGSAS